MIIDTHLHEGTQGSFSLSYDSLIRQMDKNNIDKGLVSPVTACEYQPDKDELFPEQIPQITANQVLLKKIAQSNGRLYLSFWCKPATEKNTMDVYDFIRRNRSLIRGMKFHPFYSRMPLEDQRYVPYIEMAEQLRLPVSVHTAADSLSCPEQLLAMANRHPAVPFIMVHMGLFTDNEQAIQCLGRADNLYGDTTWVPLPKVEKAMLRCGSRKILFGSDAPIDGEKSYDFYADLLKIYRETPSEDWERVMHRNAEELFGL